jgi:hypothetical protein
VGWFVDEDPGMLEFKNEEIIVELLERLFLPSWAVLVYVPPVGLFCSS